MRAWYRDSRLVGIALRTFVLPIFFVLQAVFTGTPGLAGIGIVTLAVFAGLTLMNDLAFDGPAWWLHVAVGVRGWEDRLGRAIASTVVFGPVVVLTYVVSVLLGVISNPVSWLTVVVVSFFASLGLAVGGGRGAARARHHAPAATRSRRRRAVPRRAASPRSCRSSGRCCSPSRPL